MTAGPVVPARGTKRETEPRPPGITPPSSPRAGPVMAGVALSPRSRDRRDQPGLLQQPGQAAVGERLAPGLAGRAVLERGVGEGDLAHGVAADRAGLARPAVHAQARLLLGFELPG